MADKKEKRVLTIELDDNVKKVSITGLGDDNQVVMAQELSEEELDQATGGMSTERPSGQGGQYICDGISWRDCASNEISCSDKYRSCPAQELPDLFYCWSKTH